MNGVKRNKAGAWAGRRCNVWRVHKADAWGKEGGGLCGRGLWKLATVVGCDTRGVARGLGLNQLGTDMRVMGEGGE